MATLGIYGPKIPERSGVANYIELTREGLSRFFECTHVANRNLIDPTSFDYVLYHVGASARHHCVFTALHQRPGPAIIHEHNILSYYYESWSSISEEEQKCFLAQVSNALGKKLQSLDALLFYLDGHPDYDRWSADVGSEGLFMDKLTLAVTHSPFIKNCLSHRYANARIETLPYPVKPFDLKRALSVRSRMCLDENDYLFGTFGFIGEYKRVEKILDAWSAWTDRPHRVKLLVLGERQYQIRIPEFSDLIYVDYVEDEETFDAYLAAADCAVQLRHPTLGETSAVISKMLAHHKRVIISDTAYNAHYKLMPHTFSVRPDENEVSSLVTAFRKMIQEPRPISYYEEDHSLELFTKRLAGLILSHKSS